MKSLADGLPPHIAQQIHPDWRKNEAAYWAVRDQLLSQYRGQWIGLAGGQVVAAGPRPVAVFHAAHQAAKHPYIICVGREEQPYRMRRAMVDVAYAKHPHVHHELAKQFADFLVAGPRAQVWGQLFWTL